MNWIAIATAIVDDPSIGALSEDIKRDVVPTVGHVVLVLCKLPQHAPDGSLGSVTDSTIEQWARWRGARGVFAAAFRARLCTDDRGVRAWEKYNGAAQRASDSAKERMRLLRLKRKNGGSTEAERTEETGVTFGERSANVTGTFASNNTIQNNTAPSAPSPNGEAAAAAPPAAAAAAPPSRVFEVLTAIADVPRSDAVRDALSEARNPSALAVELLTLHHGIGEQDERHAPRLGVPWPVLCHALHDMRIAEAKLSPKVLAAFVQRIEDDARKAAAVATPAAAAPVESTAVDLHQFSAIKYARQGNPEWQAECEKHGWLWQEVAS